MTKSTEVLDLKLSGELAALLQGEAVDNSALSAGIGVGFASISFRGKVWRVRHDGEAKPILYQGDPIPAILCVIVEANPKFSKLYFKNAYEEGSNDVPTCYSLDGERPEPASAEIQAKSCAVCPHNVWGSKITPQGTKTKACSDSRRLAIVPYPDIENAAYGGPMLLRVPPASFKEMARYARELEEQGLPFTAVITRIGFETEASFPKLTFRAVKAVTADEYRRLKDMRELQVVKHMLSASEADIATMAPDPGSTEDPAPARGKPTGVAAKAQEAAKQSRKPTPVAKEPDPEPEDEGEEETPLLGMMMGGEEPEESKRAEKPKAAKPKAAKPKAAEAAEAEGEELPADLESALSMFR